MAFSTKPNTLYDHGYSNKVRPTPQIYSQKIIALLKPTQHDKVLEIGVNRGELFGAVGNASRAQMYGVDINKGAIARLNTKHTYVASATKLPFHEAFFDKAYSTHVLEHIKALDVVLAELARVVKIGGLVFHAFPAYLPFVPRGFDGALIDSLGLTKNPFKAIKMARQLHVHKLSPHNLMRFDLKKQWQLNYSARIFVPQEFGFSWIVVLKRVK